ncbi:MAG: zf-TFIIB domain-containing protein, partial [Brevundimonas sp.]|uniref:TFIIB-type zinc ribbon-containing protein n=1 Tax=Brevundimonas sp. TaxID=1871086 RepID=UPI001A1C02F2
MPLLMCPNDNSAMQTLDRDGVQFDMCPACRGVWLDRGELEKLMASAAEDGRASATPAAPPSPMGAVQVLTWK